VGDALPCWCAAFVQNSGVLMNMRSGSTRRKDAWYQASMMCGCSASSKNAPVIVQRPQADAEHLEDKKWRQQVFLRRGPALQHEGVVRCL